MQITGPGSFDARKLLSLARTNKGAAARALARLSPEEQAAVVCRTPLELRQRMLDLLESPEDVVPLLPPAELCFTCKAMGVQDAAWLLGLASDEQIVASLDLDAWRGQRVDLRRLDTWVDTLAEAGDEALYRGIEALDIELVALYLRDHVDVVLKPAGNDDWQPPDGSQTLEGQLYFSARRQGDDLAPLQRILRVLFERDYWLYFRLMQSVREESTVEIEDWALRWRTGRLEDLGFPSWEASMAVYGLLPEDRLAELPPEALALEVAEWALPVWAEDLPAVRESGLSIFRAVSTLDEDRRRAFLYAFLHLANQVAVADGRDLGDAGTLPDTLEKAARVSSLGLDYLARQNGLSPSEVVLRTPLERIFRVGVNLSPEGVRPAPSDLTDTAEVAPPEPGPEAEA